MKPERDTLAKAIGKLVEAAASVRAAYERCGPGEVDATLFEPVETSWGVLSAALDDEKLLEAAASALGMPAAAWRQQLRAAGLAACDLAHRCVFRVEGLNFFAPEVGLIPRREMVEKFETSLEVLRDQLEKLNHRA